MKVAEVMTRTVLTVTPETSLKEVARVLASRGISGLPVVDGQDHVLGVVSEADILAKERRPESSHSSPKAEARTAGEAMTAPPITVSPVYRIDAAAALMLDCGVNRLPVIDDDGKLVGIVTRADLVRAFGSSDERIEREIVEEVLLRELWLDPRDFAVTVREGLVDVVGEFDSEEQREVAVRRLRLVPGVVSVATRRPSATG